MIQLEREGPDSPARQTLIQAVDLVKIYRRGVEEVRALDGVSFEVDAGEFVAVVGPSGAGKTTLLQLIGAMDLPTSGSLRLNGRQLAGMSDSELTRIRRDHIGFVFQHFGLLPTLTVAENIALPGRFGSSRKGPSPAELLDRVGLSHRGNHRPSQLSGGEMQRAAIARALINSPALLLADEPTGNLDSAAGARIIELLHTLIREGITVIVVTHNDSLANAANRRLRLVDGRLDPSADYPNS